MNDKPKSSIRTALLAGTFFCGLSVILGAFAAHALKAQLTIEQLDSFNTGVRFQFYHGLALIALGLIAKIGLIKKSNSILWLFIAGTVLFSGSIYFLNLLEATKSWIWPFTPIGGTLLIAGWASLCYQITKNTGKS